MRRLLKLCAFLLPVWHASASVVPHYYCNIFREDGVVANPFLFWPGSHMTIVDAQAMLPLDEWIGERVSLKFPTWYVHETLCSKMNAKPAIEYDIFSETMEVRGMGVVKGASLIPNSPVSIYRAARMRDRWTDTINHIHDVFCFACRCNALTPIPPQSAKTLDDIKAQLDSYTDAEFNSRQYINTWDGGGFSPRVPFVNAPFSQKHTTLGSETVQLRYFWIYEWGIQQSPIQWPLDSIYNMGECRKACLDGYISSSSASGCDICPSGKYTPRPNMMSCTDCEAGKYSSTPGKTLSCEACPVGTYLSTTGNDSVEDCNACPLNSGNNNVTSTTVTSCTCNSGFTRQNDQSCVQCLAGKYKPHTGDAACTHCMMNQYSAVVGAVSNRCEECPIRTQAPAASNEKTDCVCDPGYSGPDGGPCLECLAGKYKVIAGSAACTDCAEDRYSDRVGAIINVCVACPFNSKSPAGSNSLLQCICKPGTMTNADATCTICKPGTFSDKPGAVLCELCAAGKSMGNRFGTACRDCTPGKYANGTVASPATECTSCTQLDGIAIGSNAAACVKCKRGQFWSSSSACKECLPGEFLDGNDVCTGCTALGKDYCAKMKTTLDTFGWGLTQVNLFTQQCPAIALSYASGAPICDDCGCSFFRDALTAGTVDTCDITQRLYLNGTTRICEYCPMNRNINNNPDRRSCDLHDRAMEHQVWNEAVAQYQCIPGYSHVSNSNNCVSCAAGKYQDAAGQGACIVCPGGTTTRGGASIGVQDCSFCSFDHRLEQSRERGAFSCQKCEPCTVMRQSLHMEKTCSLCGFYEYDKALDMPTARKFGAACVLTRCLSRLRTDDVRTGLFQNLEPRGVNQNLLSALYDGGDSYVAVPGRFDNIFASEELKWWISGVVPIFDNSMEQPYRVYISFVDFYFRLLATMLSGRISFNGDILVTTWTLDIYKIKVKEIVAIYNALEAERRKTIGSDKFPSASMINIPRDTLGSRHTSIAFDVPSPDFELITNIVFHGEQLTARDCQGTDRASETQALSTCDKLCERCKNMFAVGSDAIKFNLSQPTITFADLSRFILQDVSFAVQSAKSRNSLNVTMQYRNSADEKTTMLAALHWQRSADPVYRQCTENDSPTKHARIHDPWAFSRIRDVFRPQVCTSLDYA